MLDFHWSIQLSSAESKLNPIISYNLCIYITLFHIQTCLYVKIRPVCMLNYKTSLIFKMNANKENNLINFGLSVDLFRKINGYDFHEGKEDDEYWDGEINYKTFYRNNM